MLRSESLIGTNKELAPRMSPPLPQVRPIANPPRFRPGLIEILAVSLEAPLPAVHELAGFLSREERDRAARFVRAGERRRYIVARGCLRMLLAERLACAASAIEIAYLAHGKPIIAGRHSNSGLCFNLSHSDGLAVYAFAHRKRIGIDIERVRSLANADDIAEHMFSRSERKTYFSLDPPDRPLGFFNCWTRKEAFVKATGDGLSRPLDSFDVSLAPGDEARILGLRDGSRDSCGWNLESFAVTDDFVGAVVTQEEPDGN